MRTTFSLIVALLLLAGRPFQSRAADDSEALNLTISLIGDSDKEIRAAGLQQVREGLKGKENTEKLAAHLPKLSADAQVSLLSALADRGDRAAAGEARKLLSAKEEKVQVAAIEALGTLGGVDDAAPLLKLLANPSQAVKTAAQDALVRLKGDETTAALIVALKQAGGDSVADLINILTARRAEQATTAVLATVVDDRAAVRQAAMAALARLAQPDQAIVAGMMRGVLRAEPGAERDAAELALKAVCDKNPDPDKRAMPALTEMTRLNRDQVIQLLPAVGRIGGKGVFEYVDGLISGSSDMATREAAVRALCLWPDVSVAPRLIELTNKPVAPALRTKTLQALIRVSTVKDKRSDADRLALLKQALQLAETDQERNIVVRRAGTIHSLDAFHWVLPYLDQPQFAQKACEAVVEMAHHRELRDPNKTEFDPALDKVIKLTKNPVTADEAARYQKGQTFNRANKKED